jgi:lipopolysaccharide/colanic/teichoic acid biosynthesis glycosyltransferase
MEIISIEETKDKESFIIAGGKMYGVIKRFFDISLSLIVLIITFPIYLLIAFAIKIEDGGSVLYFQKRCGKDKKLFSFVKFRTMIEGAEKKTGPKWADEKDSRVTKVGNFLRITHLDEIPQMKNILVGEMSFVGPRPERPEFVEILENKVSFWNLRTKVLPGFTGLAQVKFRYARTVDESREKLKYDLDYLQHRSLRMDAKILFQTFLKYCLRINTTEKDKPLE